MFIGIRVHHLANAASFANDGQMYTHMYASTDHPPTRLHSWWYNTGHPLPKVMSKLHLVSVDTNKIWITSYVYVYVIICYCFLYYLLQLLLFCWVRPHWDFGEWGANCFMIFSINLYKKTMFYSWNPWLWSAVNNMTHRGTALGFHEATGQVESHYNPTGWDIVIWTL